MQNIIQQIKSALEKYSDKQKAEKYAKFFKTGKGEYGEGDIFIGVQVPYQRKVAKAFYKDISIAQIKTLLTSKIHEHRLTALLILTYKFPKSSDAEKNEIKNFYLAHTFYINNWDLVDLSAPKILGAYLVDHPKKRNILYKLANSKLFWDRRIAILSTYAFIKNNDFEDALKISEILLNDEHDLIHKAVGWMLREIGNISRQSREIEEKFLKKYYKKMPRTMLRYAIEKFPDKKRKFYLAK
jgi:3-methyladenine DNA glycosylase AlkD